jgi:predicted GNAT family acetyltransferase
VADISVRPVTAGNWADFARLFEARGSPHYCWCSIYRFLDTRHVSSPEKKEAISKLAAESVPIGVLAYDGEEPAGWCSIAPRETYAKLGRSRKMPRVTPEEVSTWAVMCFFVPRSHRGRGVALALLQGAIEYARAMGAAIIEAYPFDAAGVSATHRGHSSLYLKAGFQGEGARWSLDLRSKHSIIEEQAR